MSAPWLAAGVAAIAAWLLVNIVPFVGAAFGVFSVLRIALGGA